MKKIINNVKNGITLFAIVIVIVIILILVGAIVLNLKKSGTINSANEATLKSDLQSIKDAYKIKYDDLLYQYRGQSDKIKEEDLEDIIPEEYKPDFVILPEGPAYVGEDEKVKEIAREMEYIIGNPTNKIEIEYVNLDSTVDTIEVEVGIKQTELEIKNIEYYISKDGENWDKIDSKELTNVFSGLEENVKYKIKVIVIDENDQTDESDIYEIRTKEKEFEAGEVELRKIDENGEEYISGEWTKENVHVKLKDEVLDSTYEVYGANEIEKGTKENNLLTNSGVSKIRVTTKKNDRVKAREYEVKIDKDIPEITGLISENIEPTNQNVTIEGKAIDRLSGIVAYMFSENGELDANSEGWEKIEKTTNGTTKKKEVEQNGTYYFYVKDEAGNVAKREIIVNNIDKTDPTLESINVTSPEAGIYKAGQEVTIVATYSENIKGIAPVLKIKFGTSEERTATAGAVSENKITYTYTIVSGDNGVLASTSYTGSVTDLVGNNLILENKALGGNVITADTIAPTLSSINVTSPEAGIYKAGQEVTIVATYSENIKGTAPVLKIKFGTSEERTTTAGAINGNKVTYIYTIANGDNGVLASTSYTGSVTDIAGNSLTVSNKTLGGNIITADTIAPTLSSINVTSPEAGIYKAGQEVTIVSTYSENIKGTAPVLKIKFGTSEERTTVGAINGNKVTYTYTIANGDNGVLASTSYTGSVTDMAGNSLTVSNKTLGGNSITADTIAPTNTTPTLVSNTNSITATFRQTDALSGTNNVTRQYAIKKSSDSTWGSWIADNNATHVFSNLTMNTSYQVKTKVSDNVGNEGESQVATINTVNITKPTLSAPTEWTKNNVTVTITYPSIIGTTRQYSTDGSNWSNVSGTTQTVTVSENKTTVYARIIDSTNQTSGNATYEVACIDKALPTVSIGTNGGEYVIPVGKTNVSMTTKLSASDTGGSRLNVLQYQISKSASVPADNDGNWKNFTNDANITEALTGGTNYLYTKVIDTAGNRATSIQKSNAYVVKYEVKYNANGGSTAPGTQAKVHGTDLVLSNTALTKTGYTFKGWATTNNATTAEYSAGGKYTKNEAVELYAVYTVNSYTVTYNYTENGGTSSTKTSASVKYNIAIDLTPTATKSGYTFVGWNTNKDATTGLTSLTMGTSNVTLYAIYKKAIVGTFYYYDGTQAASKTVTGYAYNKNTSASITTPTISNVSKDSLTYTQRGWSTGTNAGGTISVNSGGSATLSSNTTYYASYKTTITANFYYSGNKVATSSSGRYLNYKGEYTYTYITIPSSVTSSTGASGTSYSHVSTTKTGSSVNPTTRTTNYYAIYKKTVTVTKYVYNNSSSTATGTAYEYYDGTKTNASINLGTHSLSGYTFRGWSTSSSGNATINVASNNSASVFNNTTYYGSYSYTATLTYNLNGGRSNAPSSQSTTCYMNYVGTKKGGTINISSSKPSWGGYVFTNWYASDSEDSYDSIGSTYTISQNTTIYAHWQQKPNVKYQAHIEDYGWRDFVSDGSTAGTIGENKRMESFNVVPYYISTNWKEDVDIRYRAYGANGVYYPSSVGYNMSEVYANSTSEYVENCGVTGQSLKLTGIIIKFGSSYIESLFDIWYRVHVEDYGYLPWTKNGNIAGYIGDANQKKIEALEVVISLKGNPNPSGNTNYTVGNQYAKVALNPPAHTCNTNGYCNVVHTVSTSYNYSSFTCSDGTHGNHTQYRHPVCTVCGKINQSSFKFKCPTAPAGTQMPCPDPGA